MKRKYDPETTLVSKLRTLKPGETLYLDDPRDMKKNTMLDRSVQAAAFKSDILRGRRFSTARCIAVQTSPVVAKPILAIRRHDVPKSDE